MHHSYYPMIYWYGFFPESLQRIRSLLAEGKHCTWLSFNSMLSNRSLRRSFTGCILWRMHLSEMDFCPRLFTIWSCCSLTSKCFQIYTTISRTVLKGEIKYGHGTFSDIRPALGMACAKQIRATWTEAWVTLWSPPPSVTRTKISLHNSSTLSFLAQI